MLQQYQNLKSDKQSIIKNAEAILHKAGFSNVDYVISLQGPTVIFAKTGEAKLTDSIRKSLEETGIEIL